MAFHCGHPNRNPPELCILSDAYDVVCGSFIPFKSRVFRQSWSDAEGRCSTTYRELSVVLFSLEAFSKN